MIKKVCLLSALLLPALAAPAQTVMSSKEMVAITPIVCDDVNIPADGRASLNTKMTQIVTQNGMGSSSMLLALTPNVVFIDKQVTTTAPAQFIVELEVSLYLLDVEAGVVLDEMSFNVKGIDRLENKAIVSAINSIKAKSPQTKAFMDRCRTKVIDYYNTRIPTLITKAESLAERQQYDEALAVLGSIPENVDQYPMVADRMAVIYKQMIDKFGAQALQQAKAKVALREYSEAFDLLSVVDPMSSSFKEADALIASVKKNLDDKERAARELEMRRYEQRREDAMRAHDDAVTIKKQEIDAAKSIGKSSALEAVATGSSEGSFQKKVNKWFMNFFRR